LLGSQGSSYAQSWTTKASLSSARIYASDEGIDGLL
jgi:hypothetical protein